MTMPRSGAEPDRLSDRAKRIEASSPRSGASCNNFAVYGVRKVWRQMQTGGHRRRCRSRSPRLMGAMGLRGVVRGEPVRTTVSDKATPCPLDRVNRQFQAPRPNVLWVSDFAYRRNVAGFVYVAFVMWRSGRAGSWLAVVAR